MGSRENLIGKNVLANQVDYFSNELQINKNTPPAFLVHSADDEAVPVLNSINYFLGLKKFNIPVEMHIFPKGGHGYGLGRGNGTESSWSIICEKWLRQLM